MRLIGVSLSCIRQTVLGEPNGHVGKGVDLNDELLSHKVQIERKFFYFHLKENPRGRFLKITEDVNGRRDTIIVPATGLDRFRDVLEGFIRYDGNGSDHD